MNTLVPRDGAQWWLTRLAHSASVAASPPLEGSCPVLDHTGDFQTSRRKAAGAQPC